MPENVKIVEARAQKSFCRSVKRSNLNNVVVCRPCMYFLIKIKHCDKKTKNIFAAGHTVSSAAQCSLSSLHSHCVHVGPTHSRDSFSVFLFFPLEVQNSEAKVPLRVSWGSFFCLATMAQFVAVSQMRLHTGMSPWRSASGFFCRRDP